MNFPSRLGVFSLIVALLACAGADNPATGASSGGASGSGGNGGSGGTGAGGAFVSGSGGAAPVDGGGGETSPTGDAGGGSPAAFIGVWQYQIGKEKLECPTGEPLMGDLKEARLTFEAGSDAPLLLTSPTCSLRLDVEGNKTVLRPGQTCDGQIGNTPVLFRPQTFTFEVNGSTAQQSGLWNVTMMPADQPVRECMLTSSGTLSKR